MNDSNDNSEAKSMESLVAAQALQLLDQLAEKWSRIVIPIFVPSQKRRNALDGIGSAFVAAWGKQYFFVTAQHVVDDILTLGQQGRVAVIANKKYFLQNVKFYVDRENDLAAARLEQIILQTSLINPVDLSRNFDDCLDTDWFFMQGYPSKKNQLERGFGKLDRKIHSYTLAASSSTLELKRSYPAVVRFEYNPRKMINSTGNRIEPPQPNGVSGGPIFRVLFRPEANQFTLDLSAVVVFWHRETDEILGISKLALQELLLNIPE